MKILAASIVIGLIMLFFLDAALKIENLNQEMLIHNTLRFFTGFFILGIRVWYKRSLKLGLALYIILALLLTDSIMDFLREINNFRLEMLFHDSFMVLWGAVIGYFYTPRIKKTSRCQSALKR
ncbi:MAG: hypothetical protein CVV13_14370 [Gammaproteobacteria bacterium HGW-Gammaproteobacteria-3]|nr:MAG: hypothetical protein CVV13_14370 [Gammaproteobacteria bacterium HGW-Gammaproteobacteria-3]